MLLLMYTSLHVKICFIGLKSARLIANKPTGHRAMSYGARPMLSYMSESNILGPIDYLSDIEIWYWLNGLCLKITFSNTERKYSYYLCQYLHFEVNAGAS